MIKSIFWGMSAVFLLVSVPFIQADNQMQSEAEIYGAAPVQSQDAFADDIHNITRHFHPRLAFTTEYESNVFLEPSNEKDDFIFVLSPGLQFFLPFSGQTHLLTFDYHTDLAAFSDFEDENFDNHYFTINLDLNFPRFYVKTSDNFRITSLRSSTEFQDRIDRNENVYAINAGTELNKWAFDAGYDSLWVNYRSDGFEGLDRWEHTVGGSAFYQVFPKSNALVEYKHSFINYDDAPDREGESDEVQAGLKGEIFQKLVGTIKAGYQNRRYDNSDQDFSNFVTGVSLVHNYSVHTTFTLAVERSNKESIYKNNNFYTQNYVSLTVNQKLFFERLDGRLRFSYQNNDYQTSTTELGVTQTRNDDLFGVDVGVDYKIRDWLTTGVDYFYLDRNSNFGLFDFVDHRVLWKLAVLL